MARQITDYRWAADRYADHLSRYHLAVSFLNQQAGSEVRSYLLQAAQAQLNRQCRGVATALTAWQGAQWATAEALGAARVDIDHAVPLAMIHRRIQALSPSDSVVLRTNIEAILRQSVVGVKLTRDQHLELNRQYHSSMPETWCWGQDALARYKALGWPLISLGQPQATT